MLPKALNNHRVNVASSAKQLPPSVNLDRSLITAGERGVSIVIKTDKTARKMILAKTCFEESKSIDFILQKSDERNK